MNSKVTINRLATGVPGLDEVLGGGLPEFSTRRSRAAAVFGAAGIAGDALAGAGAAP